MNTISDFKKNSGQKLLFDRDELLQISTHDGLNHGRARTAELKILFKAFDVIHAICKTRTVQKLNTKYGHSDSNVLYGTGYRVNLSSIKEFKRDYLA